MSAENDHIAALRDAGHDDAANFLTERQEERRDMEQKQRTRGEPRPRIPLMSSTPADHQAAMEGQHVAEMLRATDIGRWGSAGSLLTDDGKGDRR